mmetsp:Transcript_39902/g.55467  ORF Transcript_39902/g.55467 Transcript_39902/m.55467 type:complete len:455 (+) Transcript_39902:22-1386(+)
MAPTDKTKKKRKVPLEQQLEEDQSVMPKMRRPTKTRPEHQNEEAVIGKKMSNKILLAAQSQLEEMDEEENARAGKTSSSTPSLGRTALTAAAYNESDSEDEEFSDTEDVAGELEITEEDAALIEKFMDPTAGETRTLADMIMERIREQKGGQAESGKAGALAVPGGVDAKVAEVYTEVGRLLQRYKAGKVPKAFKIIPALNNWEEVLYMTSPDSWSPHAMFQATRLFASNLNPKMAQRFYNLVLLPAVRQDIKKNKRLHFALFQAIKKAVYKPGSFYKGLLLPLCSSGSCTVREAVIWSSMLARVSIPVLHSSVALLKLSQMTYSGTNSFFILQLLNKKYALPHRVLDALVDHFCGFQAEERALPVIWHQALLTLVQRYKGDISREDKARLKALIKVHFHYLVTSEIRRELAQGTSRGEKAIEDTKMSIDPIAMGTATHENPREMPPVIMDEDI